MDRGWGVPLVIGNIFFTLTAMLALKLGGWDGVAVVMITAGYFIVSNTALILTATGGLRDVLITLIEQAALLLKIMLLISWRARQPQEPSTGLLQVPQHDIGDVSELISTDYRTFVSPVAPRLPALASHDQAARQQARAWLVGLFDERTGELDQTKVYLNNDKESAGRLWEAAPLGDAKSYLLARGLILKRQNGYALNLAKVGTLRDVESA